MIHYTWTSAILGFAIACVILVLVRRDFLHSRYAFWWLLAAAASVILGAFPQLVDVIGARTGVHYPPILLVVTAIGMILVKILTMDVDRSRQELEIRRLAQRLALLEKMKGRTTDEKTLSVVDSAAKQ